MVGYLWRRLRYLPVSLLLVLFVTFSVLRLTGNPVDIYLDMNRTPEQVEALTQKLHLDRPLVVQFGIYLRDVVKGDLGSRCSSAFLRSKSCWIASEIRSSWSHARWGWP